jgi:hypothetical protein
VPSPLPSNTHGLWPNSPLNRLGQPRCLSPFRITDVTSHHAQHIDIPARLPKPVLGLQLPLMSCRGLELVIDMCELTEIISILFSSPKHYYT